MHSKAKLRKMSYAELLNLVYFMLTFLKATNPKAYKEAEESSGLSGGRKRRLSRATKRSGRSPPKNWRVNLAKAIRANKRMSAEAKRKALKKLRQGV